MEETVRSAMQPVTGTPFGDGYRNSTDETARIVMVALRTQRMKVVEPSMSIDEAGVRRTIGGRGYQGIRGTHPLRERIPEGHSPLVGEDTGATWGTCLTLDCEAVETPPAMTAEGGLALLRRLVPRDREQPLGCNDLLAA